MGLALLLSGFALLGLPGLTRRLGQRLAPREWAWLCAIALAVGAAVVETAVLLHAAPTVLRSVGITAVASACERVIGPMAPGGRTAGWAAASAAAAVPVLAAFGLVRARRLYAAVRVEPSLGKHRRLGPHELVVLPTDEVLAMSVAGRPGQILLSEGLVASLPPAQLAAVLRHEAVHLDHHHQRALLLATALEQAFVLIPPVRRSTAVLRTALERWADEAAVGEDREMRDVLRDALLTMADVLIRRPVAAFSPAATVVERLDALDAQPPRPSIGGRAFLYLPSMVLGVVVLVALGAWVADVQTVMAMAGRCPA